MLCKNCGNLLERSYEKIGVCAECVCYPDDPPLQVKQANYWNPAPSATNPWDESLREEIEKYARKQRKS